MARRPAGTYLRAVSFSPLTRVMLMRIIPRMPMMRLPKITTARAAGLGLTLLALGFTGAGIAGLWGMVYR